MIFTRDYLTRKNHRRIAFTREKLVIHVNSYIILYINKNNLQYDLCLPMHRKKFIVSYYLSSKK